MGLGNGVMEWHEKDAALGGGIGFLRNPNGPERLERPGGIKGCGAWRGEMGWDGIGVR